MSSSSEQRANAAVAERIRETAARLAKAETIQAKETLSRTAVILTAAHSALYDASREVRHLVEWAAERTGADLEVINELLERVEDGSQTDLVGARLTALMSQLSDVLRGVTIASARLGVERFANYLRLGIEMRDARYSAAAIKELLDLKVEFILELIPGGGILMSGAQKVRAIAGRRDADDRAGDDFHKREAVDQEMIATVGMLLEAHAEWARRLVTALRAGAVPEAITAETVDSLFRERVARTQAELGFRPT